MACSIFSRLFQHGALRRLHLFRSPSTAPPVPASASASSTSPPGTGTTAIGSATEFQKSFDNLILLNTMAHQGSPHLTVRNVDLDPITSFSEIDQVFGSAEGYVGLTSTKQVNQENGPNLYDFVYTFRTAADATNALITQPMVVLRGHAYSLSPHDPSLEEPRTDSSEPSRTRTADAPPPDSDISPPRKRLKKEQPPEKLTCRICFTELDGLYSTPCRQCKGPRCYDCLKAHFRTAMRDIERMPVTCCGYVMHHEVAKGVLPDEEFEAYKQKYDERINTVDPLYCPVPTCSTFIPPRMFPPNDTKVACHTCGTQVCTKCKQHAEDEHVCATEDSRKFILETFRYKICPRCGTGVMKMFGCPHVRCQCGAHWCWDCQRPMSACYQKPCSAAREDGNYSEGEDDVADSEDDVPANNESATAATEAPETTAPEPVVADEANPDLRQADADTLQEREQEAAEVLTSLRDVPAPAPTLVAEPMQEIQSASLNTEITTEESAQNNEDATQPEVDGPVQELEAPSAENPPPDAPVSQPATDDAAPTQESTNTAMNLDDPFQHDWEGASLDFGEEPTDESWDIWGCRHRFEDLGKDRVPSHWLVGVDPEKDTSLEVECMGCFKKAKVWDDTPATANSTSKKTDKLKRAVECSRGGCGVVFCGACKKAARKRMLKERTATANTGN